jgi:hypothetical protein
VRPGLLLTFAAMGAATYLTRAPLLLALARRRLPGRPARRGAIVDWPGWTERPGAAAAKHGSEKAA